jgi:hypothetical protein
MRGTARAGVHTRTCAVCILCTPCYPSPYDSRKEEVGSFPNCPHPPALLSLVMLIERGVLAGPILPQSSRARHRERLGSTYVPKGLPSAPPLCF